jgi:hypothetical protein
MARIRTIKPEFPQSETIGAMSRDARLLFVQLWTIVDDAGRARAASRMLASLLYPYDDDARELIGPWLDELEQAGAIRRYEVDGSTYLEVVKWLEHQKIDRPSPSRLPEYREPAPKPREESRASDADLGPRTVDRTKDQDHSRSVAVATRTEAREKFSDDFERLWTALPKRDGPNPKKPAFKKFSALVKTGVPPASLIEAATQAADAARKRGDFGTRFIPSAIVWLNQERWADAAAELFQAENAKPQGNSNGRRTVHEAASDLAERLRALDEPAPGSLRGGPSEGSVRLLSSG